MTAPRYDVIGIGNAIVDVIARAEDDFLVAHGMHKGTMALIDEARAEKIYQAMGPAVESSGGSAANTIVGVAAEARHADDGVGGRTARAFHRRPHRLINFLGARLVDQRHGAFVHAVRDQEIVLGAGDHVNDGVADADYVVAGGGHALPRK